jgi:hypothetical protein
MLLAIFSGLRYTPLCCGLHDAGLDVSMQGGTATCGLDLQQAIQHQPVTPHPTRPTHPPTHPPTHDNGTVSRATHGSVR